MTKDAIERISGMINEMVENYETLDRATIDELFITADNNSALFHPRFNEVLGSLDSNFDPDYLHYTLEKLNRLQRIIDVSAKLGSPEQTLDFEEFTPTFELEQDDKDQMLKLSSGMRKIVFTSTIFDAPHKRRLLNRLAAMEHEIHQKKGRLDVILAGVQDVGETLRKFGQDIEPLSKRMQEFAGLARKGSKEYDQIPPPDEQLKLPHHEDE
tara:strand:- start:177 stop:812 length:636 start_codon:yes stop_codon:yes gene_type:complete